MMRRHKHFKCFFAACDPTKPTPPRESHPNWKVQGMLKHTLFISKEAVCMGRYISVDEQTMSCKGSHPDILRINYKKEGDGFQCDAVCSDGYTYCFFFRNQQAPKKWIDLDVSPLHAQCLSLFEQLPGKNYSCGMDNLYNSCKFFK